MAKKLSRSAKQKREDPLVCLCNGIPLSQIKRAILEGAKTTDEIGDKTTAGIGACGGTCRPQLKNIFEETSPFKPKKETPE